MFKLLPLVSEHAIRIISCFKNEKTQFRNLLSSPGNLQLEKLVIEKFSEKNRLCK